MIFYPSFINGGTILNTDGAPVYENLMHRFGHFGPNNQSGLGDHHTVIHKDGEFSQHILIDEDGAQRSHYVITTNTIEGNWSSLRRNLRSTKEFFDDDGDLIHHIDTYIDRHVYFKRRYDYHL